MAGPEPIGALLSLFDRIQTNRIMANEINPPNFLEKLADAVYQSSLNTEPIQFARSLYFLFSKFESNAVTVTPEMKMAITAKLDIVPDHPGREDLSEEEINKMGFTVDRWISIAIRGFTN